MISIARYTAVAALAAAAIGCRPSFGIHTMAAPQVGRVGLASFRMLPAPIRRDGRSAHSANDPMLTDSPANRVIRDRIVRTFRDRGYTLDERHADVAVAFYATAHDKLDITTWDYGYPVRLVLGQSEEATATTQYGEGTIVVDVIDPSTRVLLWRGVGRAKLSNDTDDDAKALAKVAESIVTRFPVAMIRAVAARR